MKAEDIVDTVRQGIAKFTHETACGIIGVETLAVHREVLEKLCNEVDELRKTKREWSGLTDDEKKLINIGARYHWEMTTQEYANLIQAMTEAKLKEKNT